jgi:rod shape determining protein RodA
MKLRDYLPASIAELPLALLSVICALAGFGVLVLYSAQSGGSNHWAQSQALHFIVFFFLALLLSRVPVERWKQIAMPGFGVLVFLLLIVVVIGKASKGGQRWLNLGFMNLQPSELMKLFIVLAMAWFFDMLPAKEMRRISALGIAAGLIILPAGLIMLQPDLGTALMVIAGGVVVAYLAGTSLRIFGAGALGAVLMTPVLWHFMKPYQKERVMTLLNPASDAQGKGYHIMQSKIAIGSGGIFGKGFMQGTQSHLHYLPERETDFVFATMAEEWGLLGGIAVIAGFLYVIHWAFGVAERSQTRFAKLTASGLATTLFFYMSINIMMVMGVIPVVGVPLPFISYGGTAMMTVMGMLGVLMSLDRSARVRTGLR